MWQVDERFFSQSKMKSIVVDVASQCLDYLEHGVGVRSYAVSTSRYGLGEKRDSFKTPRGRHVIRAKIGIGMPAGSVFSGRRPTGETVMPNSLAETDSDLILSRILWLSGLESGKNRGRDVDTMARYIYIHGTPFENLLGTAASCGCVRMASTDVIELFDLVPVGTKVVIS